MPRLESETLRDHALQGRSDDLDGLPDARRELDLLQLADAALVGCQEDAVLLRSCGFARDLILVPPTGLIVQPPGLRERRSRETIAGPPHVLFVGSETTANLDGLRWFRREVFPRVLRAVPTCRLRLVGEAGRYIDPDAGLDRLGRVEDLDAEYRAASAVVLPIRMGSGIRRRAVEALVRGKVLCTTRRGAAGTGAQLGGDAIVSDAPEVLAAELARVLTSKGVRRAMERRAARLGIERFAASIAVEPLARCLGVGEPRPATPEVTALVSYA